MRRITRLRRPSGLSANITRSQIAPLVGQSPSVSSHNISTSPRRPIPTASLQSPAFARLYSTEKQPPNSQSPSSEAEKPQEGEQSKELALSESESTSKVAEEDPEEALEEYSEEPQWTTFIPPPHQRTYTERADEVSDKTYKPALLDDGLEVVGGTERWWSKLEHWPKSANFISFRPHDKVHGDEFLEAAVRRAVVEAFALKQAGKEGALVAKWPIKGQAEMNEALKVQLSVKPDGGVALEGNVKAVLEALVEDAAEHTPRRPALPIEELTTYRSAWGKDWKTVSLADPRIKFAVTKRIFQLTGHRIQDFQLSGITNVQTLLHVVQKPAKPKTLTQEIQEKRQDLTQLPNVFVAAKRITRGDKEKAVGRFKLIEEQYKKRQLPLVGHGSASTNMEIPRMLGAK
ncbi:ribosomal subunit 39S-domain-containing protein [Annulohypoxylon maeteangense]|uniref:ribosomal subunit 39S-domain-containing protein n=1 Tax=Annulohypoxylon maeteangense TaxID=1927788 RepID=UPI0020087287|nr:ribosomal subunit 39S-domain-containing protein [Annulohypoxylon maeteangense]KAI0888491.1 ribosomal subunit 39S-domain-containing protein [Annulohypoxylon maeteangense]